MPVTVIPKTGVNAAGEPASSLTDVEGVFDTAFNATAAVAATVTAETARAEAAEAALAAAVTVGSTFTFSQAAPASTWTIVHNLGRYPAVSVVDSANTQVEGDVTYVSANEITVAFASGFSGEAYLN
jgi:hypothetical protein